MAVRRHDNIKIDRSRVRDLGGMILQLYPSLSSKIEFVVAVNHKVAGDAIRINYIDEVALLPLVSGG